MRTPPRVRIALGTLVAVVGLPVPVALASVAGVVITDGSGGEVSVSPASKVRLLEPTIRLQPQPNSTQYYTVSVIGPDGGAAATGACGRFADGLVVGYRGNGTYNVLVTSYASDACDVQAGAAQTYAYTQASAVSLVAPAEVVLLRAANSTVVKPVALPLTRLPGGLVEARFARNGNVTATGGIAGGGAPATVDGSGTTVSFVPREPGSYLVVARQAVASFATPWSAPAVVRTVAPFDLERVSFPDTGGPVYRVRGVVREPAAAKGTVTVAVARGSRGGSFKGSKDVTVASDGSFTARFRAASGTNRIRVTFGGNDLVVRGEQIVRFSVRKGRLKR